jgi:hypothetical protein
MDARTEREIAKAVKNLLREMGVKDPPLRPEAVIEHLRLHREFYSLEDPGLVQRVMHAMRVSGHKALEAIRRIKLSALWFPDENKIAIDADLHKLKKNWASFHEVMHSVLKWHRPYFLGDTAETLDPDFQARLEEEANYGASALMFCGPRFTADARDTQPEWSSIKVLEKRYRGSLTATLRRYVQHGHDLPLAMMVSTPPWSDNPGGQSDRWRHFVPSPQFAAQFPGVGADDLRQLIDAHAYPRRGGIVGDFGVALKDANGDGHEFHGETFYNTHDLLTLLVYRKPLLGSSAVVA